MQRKNTLLSSIAIVVLTCLLVTPASADIFEDDANCNKHGCAVIHDGQNYVIYDVFDATTGKKVPVGSPLIPRSAAFGGFNLTDSLDKDPGPRPDQGMMMGITQDGKNISQSVVDNGDGFLDAGDVFMSAFALTPSTDILLDGRGNAYSHSFFISSNKTKMSLHANSSINSSTDDFAGTIALSDIELKLAVSQKGNDDGFGYGKSTNKGGIKINKKIKHLGDLAAGYSELIDFKGKKGIRKKNDDLNQQTIRLDFRYTMPKYDMSMGIGSLNIDMFFELYREK